jgi:predicted GIY-YIG superfamily endonuclease
MRLDPNARGTVYLVHFSGRTSQNRQHYLGWSADIGRRFTEHTSGWGAHETRKAHAEGLKVKLAQTPDLERRIKGWSRDGAHGVRRALPVLRQGHEAA